MKYIKADIRSVKDGYIFQQCNCVTLKERDLAVDLEVAFPGTSPYKYRRAAKTVEGVFSNDVADRSTRNAPGTVFILSGETGPNIVNMFAQYEPDGPGNRWQPLIDIDGDILVPDSESDRESYFQKCLEAMFDYFEFSKEKIKIAVPYRIGCGLTGGKWQNYEKMLLDFEHTCLKSGLDIEMTIYQFGK